MPAKISSHGHLARRYVYGEAGKYVRVNELCKPKRAVPDRKPPAKLGPEAFRSGRGRRLDAGAAEFWPKRWVSVGAGPKVCRPLHAILREAGAMIQGALSNS